MGEGAAGGAEGQHDPNGEAADEAAEMRGETYLRTPEIEAVWMATIAMMSLQLAPGERRLAMTQEQTGGDTDHAHDATRSADEEVGFGQAERTRARRRLHSSRGQ